MKIRNGFVSNSSSSSFIVTFEKKPKNKKELQKILFGDRKEYPDPFDMVCHSTSTVAEIVWNDIKDQQSADLEKVTKELEEGGLELDNFYRELGVPAYPRYKEFEDSKGDVDWDSYNKVCRQWAEKAAKLLFNYEEGRFICIVEYSDNDGQLRSAMEHGDLFRHAESYFRINKH